MYFTDETQNYVQYPTLTILKTTDIPQTTVSALQTACAAQLKSFEESILKIQEETRKKPCTREEYAALQALTNRFSAWTEILRDIPQENFPAIAFGPDFHIFLDRQGRVSAKGKNDHGQSGVGNWKDIVAISAGWVYTVGLCRNGTVLVAGEREYRKMDRWRDIVAISTRNLHTLGLQKNGRVLAVGDNSYGQCKVDFWANAFTGDRVEAISAGGFHSLGLCRGRVFAAGSNQKGQCNVDSWRNITAISAGWQHSVGLTADGRVFSTGSNDKGQCETGAWKNVIAISAGMKYTLGLTADGRVLAAGDPNEKACHVSDWHDIVHIQASGFSTLGIRKDGKILAAGEAADLIKQKLHS